MAQSAEAREVTVRPLTDVSARRAYAELLAASPQNSPFLGLAFADATCAALGTSGEIVLIGDPSAPDAGAVLIEKRTGPFRAAILPPHADYSGPVLREPLLETETHARASPLDALMAAVAERYDQVMWRLHPSLADARPFTWAGWEARPTYQYIADVRSGASATANWRRTPARTLRIERESYEIDSADGATVAALETASVRRKGKDPLDESHTAALASALIASGEAHAWTARRKESGQVEAGVVATFGGDKATYWIVGGTPGPATTVLIGHLAAWARENDLRLLSLGGANVPEVAEFKRKFGTELVGGLKVRFVRGAALRLREPWVRW